MKGKQSYQFKWFNAMTAINHQKRILTLPERFVALTVFKYGNSDGTSIRPGLTRLCADVSLGRSAVGRHLKRLESLQYLELVSRGRGPGSVNLYRLSLPPDWTPCGCPLCRRPGPETDVDALEERTFPSGEPISVERTSRFEPRTVRFEPRTFPSGEPLPTHTNPETNPTRTIPKEEPLPADVTAGELVVLVQGSHTIDDLNELYRAYDHLGHIWDKLPVRSAVEVKLHSLRS